MSSLFRQSSGERRDKFERLAMPLAKSLYNVAKRWTGLEDAGDLVQETYLRAYRTFDNFKEGTNCKAWLFTIMRSVFVNEYRKGLRQPNPVSVEDLEERFMQCLGASNQDHHLKLIQELGLDWDGSEWEQALSRLPESFRSAVLLVDVEELTYEEAAQVISCPVGTLRSRLFRGRKALFLELESYASRSSAIKEPK